MKDKLQVLTSQLVMAELRASRLRTRVDVLEQEIAKLRASTSWRVTWPLRQVFRGGRALKRALTRRRWRPERDWWQRVGPTLAPTGPHPVAGTDPDLVDERITVAVIAWSVSHNPLVRAYLIAQALSRHFRVILLGPAFSRFGHGMWAPLAGTDFPVAALPGCNLPKLAQMYAAIAEHLHADAVVACKPRLPSLLLGHLLKARRDIPLFVDIDDWEPGFTKNPGAVTLESMVRAGDGERRVPFSDSWTCFCEGYLDGVDGLFSANEVLHRRFGGTLLPHARDELLFDPGRYDRLSLRAGLGIAEDDRIVLFAGTAHRYKGVREILGAILVTGDPRIKLMLIGKPEPEFEQELRQVGADRLLLLGNRPFAELPHYLACADIVCLPQDMSKSVSDTQLPAKLADALAFGLPVLATPTPPLKPLIEAGVVFETRPGTLACDLQRVLGRDDLQTDAFRRPRRDYFLKHFSYARAGRVLASSIIDHLGRDDLAPPNVLTAKVLALAQSL